MPIFFVILMDMDIQNDGQRVEKEWRCAEAALSAAREMPAGPERIEALKRAGRLRYNADQRRRELLCPNGEGEIGS